MNNALAVYDGGRFEIMQRTAHAMVASGFFKDSRDMAQAVVKIMAGAELGIPPFAAMTGINIIQGKPALGANVLATLVKNDPRYNYRVKQCTDSACVIEWQEDGQAVGESSFTIDEAKRAGLTSKDNWQKYPSDMLFARAISRGARRFAPGIFGGAPVYTPDELGADVDPDGYVDPDAHDPSPDDFNQDVPEGTYTPVITKPTTPTSIFRPGDEVIVKGKHDEKHGTVIEVNGLVTVEVDGKRLRLSEDKLSLFDMATQPALLATDTTYQE